MSKSLALKASQRIRDVWSDWASDVGHFNSLWKVRRIKGQDEVLCVQHLSIPPYRDTPNITDVLGLHVLFDFLSRHIEKIRWAVACFADDASRNKSPERILRIDLTSPILLYASTHHGAQQGEAARRSSDMRQAWHLPQRFYWSIVVQVRDVIRQFTQGTPNCNTNPKATVFGIPKEPVLETAELITSRLTGAGSLLPPVYGEAWAKGHATGTPDSTFPRIKNTCGIVETRRLVDIEDVDGQELGLVEDDDVETSGVDMDTFVLVVDERVEVIPKRTSLAGLALESEPVVASGEPRSAMQDPIQAPPGTTRQAGLCTS
ncbi:uncharacterized protein TNCV_4137381 [Trichonephila clavipes]|nr:uncharacterized protein TNCV_4137381 [Trichonephila clavipes]